MDVYSTFLRALACAHRQLTARLTRHHFLRQLFVPVPPTVIDLTIHSQQQYMEASVVPGYAQNNVEKS
jgi:hypothetical protein